MYSVLIVEDEVIIRSWLIKSLHWDELELTLAGEAENGQEALQFLEENEADIVLTDMRMPVCDGQELLKTIEERKLECEIIVVSEYSDFEYLHQAIHAHVFDYLLKPIDETELNTVFRRIVEKLRQQRNDDSGKDELSTLCNSIAFHYNNTEAIINHFLEEQRSSSCAASIVSMQENNNDGLNISVPAEQILKATKTIRLSGKRLAQFFFFKSPPSGRLDYDYQSLLQTIADRNDNMIDRIATGSIFPDLYGLARSFDEAEKAIDFQHRSRKIVSFQYAQNMKEEQYLLPYAEQQLVELLRAGRDFREELLKSFHNVIDERQYIYLPALKRMLAEFTISFERSSQAAHKGLNISSLIEHNYLDLISKIEKTEDADVFFEDLIDCCFEALIKQNTGTTEGVLKNILQVVNSRYMEELSLNQFAQEYHINYIYLSRKFKDMTGKTFTDYLMNIRMQKAKQLIEQDGFSEKETARLVGYQNPYYFVSSYRTYFEQEKKNEK